MGEFYWKEIDKKECTMTIFLRIDENLKYYIKLAIRIQISFKYPLLFTIFSSSVKRDFFLLTCSIHSVYSVFCD